MATVTVQSRKVNSQSKFHSGIYYTDILGVSSCARLEKSAFVCKMVFDDGKVSSKGLSVYWRYDDRRPPVMMARLKMHMDRLRFIMLIRLVGYWHNDPQVSS